MNPDPAVVVWPDYQEFHRWLSEETAGLNDAQLDFDSQDPAQEWMWWSIRRQMSHIACVLLNSYLRAGKVMVDRHPQASIYAQPYWTRPG